jgi:ribosomal protein S6--L-glutamate ligase
MSKVVALVSGFGWHVQDVRRAAKVVGVALDVVAFPRVVGCVGAGGARIKAGSLDLGNGDVRGVLVRMMPPGSLEQVVFRMDALHRLSALGVKVLNPPRAVEAAVDKYLALAMLDASGLPVPPTWVGESAAEALEAFDALGGDIVVKPLFGSEGRGLLRVTDRELARRSFQTLERLGAVLYLQRAIRHPGHDLRAFVLGDTVIGAIRRHAPERDWRTNVAVGGRAECCVLDPEARRMALQAARAVGAELAGVDLLVDRDLDRLVVIEVNAVPGWRALAGATGIDVAAAILTYLKETSR